MSGILPTRIQAPAVTANSLVRQWVAMVNTHHPSSGAMVVAVVDTISLPNVGRLAG